MTPNIKRLSMALSMFVVLATVYHQSFNGRPTSSGTTYDHWNGMTCASNVYPFGTQLIVHYKGKSAYVTVNDRLAKYIKDGRVDLSGKAMQTLTGSWKPITINVEVEVFYRPDSLKKK